MSPEAELVICLCRTPLSNYGRGRIAVLLKDSIDWPMVFELARRWEVQAVVCGNLRRWNDDELPGSLRDDATTIERRSRALSMAQALLLLELTKEFADTGLPVIILKGPAVALVAYGDVSLRHSGDFDLLVHRSDLAAARDLLLQRGYTADYPASEEDRLIEAGHALEFSGSASKVELHWSLLSRHLRFEIPIEELWNRSRVVPCLDSSIRILATEHLFLYLCVHGGKHEWVRFRWVCDIAQLESRLAAGEAENIVALARRTHAVGLLALGIGVSQNLGDDTRPRIAVLGSGSEMVMLPVVSRVRARFGISDDPPKARLQSIWRTRPYTRALMFWLSTRERRRDQFGSVADVAIESAKTRLRSVLRGSVASGATRRDRST